MVETEEDRAGTNDVRETCAEAEAQKEPKGWTSKMDEFLKAGTIRDIKACSGLRVDDVKLMSIGGAEYLFQSGDDYYFYNAVNDDCEKVLEPRGYAQLVDHMNSDTAQVVVETLEVEEK